MVVDGGRVFKVVCRGALEGGSTAGLAGGALTDGVNGARLMHWSEVYEVIHWKELKLTGGGGRRGEKGYSDSREQECVVTIKEAGR